MSCAGILCLCEVMISSRHCRPLCNCYMPGQLQASIACDVCNVSIPTPYTLACFAD